MEEKLEQYRLRKRRKQNWDSFKERIKHFIMPETSIQVDGNVPKTVDVSERPRIPIDEKPSNERAALITYEDEEQETDDRSIPNNESKFMKYTLWTVFFLFWVTLYIIAIELKFGIVYLMISALVGIYLNTRTGPKKPGEISAYSVFNENCEAIQGTLKAEQLEKELFFGSAIGK